VLLAAVGRSKARATASVVCFLRRWRWSSIVPTVDRRSRELPPF